jgi:galactan endo-1,6-beta-galactosidase
MTTRRQMIRGMAAAAAASSIRPLVSGPAADANDATAVDPSKNYGNWQGWGAALSWWATVFGASNTLADLLYTRDDVSYNGVDYPGLGLNVVRYNVGACTYNTVGSPPVAMNISSNIPRYKQIEGYWLDWSSSDPASSSWNWNADPLQRAMMVKARDRGADVFEMWSDSPLWWMCVNHNPSGAADGGNNLQSWNYRQHAVYLATVARYAEDNWGVTVSSVEPVNEPSASWWTADGIQEGCHLDPSIQQQLISYLRTELDSRDMTGTLVSASDENSYTVAASTWNSFSSSIRSKVGRANVHGYEYGNTGGPRTTLSNAVRPSGRPLWQSEYGEGYDHGLYLAYNLSLDLRFLHPTAWCYWQPIDSSTWGLIKSDYPDPTRRTGTLGPVANKYFVLAQYTRHIRPNMTIIDSGDQANVAAYDATNRRLVLVTVCGDSPRRITYDLSRFATVGGGIRSWVTDADPAGHIGRQYTPVIGVSLRGKQFAVDLPAHTVQTFEIDNVAK